jgi:branched-chain amino acid aminotransferase
MLNGDFGIEEVVYCSGRFLPLSEARISPLDRGFLYGDGIFTTMRAEPGHILYLKDHLERLRESLSRLRIPLPLNVDWESVLKELLRKNHLADQVASAKIVVTRGRARALGLPETEQATVVMCAQPYEPPSPSCYRKGYRLHIFRGGFSPSLSPLKTLNYLFFLMARQTAVDADFDEAVILDAQGGLAETAAGSLLLRSGGEWWTPQSGYQLPGIALRHSVQILKESGCPVARRPAGIAELFSADTVWVLNSLMGVMPVSEVDGRPVAAPASEEADQLREQLFARGR